MIIRVRPRHLTRIAYNDISQVNDLHPGNHLFFNRGRSALLFLLNHYSRLRKKKLVVAMQSFNCHVVMEAALQSDCTIVLLDIGLDDYSIGLDRLTALDQPPDVLLLTHYQGIPNQQYPDIAAYCRSNDILLIDDLSQTENSYIDNIPVGTLSDFSIHSHAFDKPFTSMYGGSLSVNDRADPRLRGMLTESYARLEFESKRTTRLHLNILSFLMKYTVREYYHRNLEKVTLFPFLFLCGLSHSSIYALGKSKIIIRILSFLIPVVFILRRQKKIRVYKLAGEKINLIRQQRTDYKFDNPEVTALERFISKRTIQPGSYPGSRINWNRYSLLDREAQLKTILDELGVEAGNHNWPVPLHVSYRKNRNVLMTGPYTNSEIAARKIVNIPVWSNFFGKLSG